MTATAIETRDLLAEVNYATKLLRRLTTVPERIADGRGRRLRRWRRGEAGARRVARHRLAGGLPAQSSRVIGPEIPAEEDALGGNAGQFEDVTTPFGVPQRQSWPSCSCWSSVSDRVGVSIPRRVSG